MAPEQEKGNALAIENVLQELFFCGHRASNFLWDKRLVPGCEYAFNVITYINEDIGPNSNYTWIAIIFSVTFAFSLLLIGRLSDLLGRRWIFIGSTAIGLLGCIVAAAARTIPDVIIGMAFIGINAGAQQSSPMILAELVPNKHRSYVSAGVVNSAAPLTISGPVFIRLMIQNISHGWRWSFGIAAICNGLAVICFFFGYHPSSFKMLHARRGNVSAWKMVDFVGVFLFVAGMLLFLLGLSWGGATHPWKSGMVIGFIAGGAVLLILFVLWEIYSAKEYPLLPTHLLKNRPFMGVVLACGSKSCVLQSGVVIGYAISACVMKPIGKQNLQFIAGMVVLAAVMGGMAGTSPSTEAMALVFLCITGASIGWIEYLSITLAPFCLKHDELGIAIGTLGTSRAALAAIAQNDFPYVSPAVIDAGLPSSSVPALLAGLASGNLTNVPDITPQIIAVAETANQAAYSIALGGLALIASLFAPNSESRFNSAISRKLHGRGIDERRAQDTSSEPSP
ncbi:TRI12-domain-containing protein [Aspergillus saccharolyticus JOP 1030-1]|uniref:TRI12-domain-containing protein n=1 Tax=Aspergillus saccharolyticus JOP 1030-1 TaxID=1450539 RepID=A0A318ZYC5_9EURO|nr:TRI12-domain-containing protein [Aspergillus saccharolyticus JOP 1030-1]PYH49200.1 TRI12-domain-containing protein [Aspergillus saccharolyticus JOP 1030-1]